MAAEHDKGVCAMRVNFKRHLWSGATAMVLAGSMAPFSMAQAPAAKKAPAKAIAAAKESKEATTSSANVVTTEEAKLPLLPGGIDEEGLGQIVNTLGLKPEKQLQRYDFAFRAEMEGTEWTLSMSAVLSQDQQSLWLMAWLDELPKSAEAVPRAALLRLLAENDNLGDGKMFAYIPNNRRFVMQRAVPNSEMTSAKFRSLLQDLGSSVVETHPIWSSSEWNKGAAPAANTAAAPTGQAPAKSAGQAAKSGAPLNTAANDPKDTPPVRKK